MSTIEIVATHIFAKAPVHIEAATGGISTTVYRLIYPNEIFYLRLLPDARDSFASEAAIHKRLSQMQIKTPEVVHFEHFNEHLQRSIMVTTAIKGHAVMQSPSLSEDARHAIVMEAGRDLARINTIAVDGFGWLRGRVKTEQLAASHATYKAFMHPDWEGAIHTLADTILSASEVRMLEQIIAHSDTWRDGEQSRLAHGDFSTRHIFQEDGHYTGIIDFGDSKGTDGWYDLGYFHMRNGKSLFPTPLEAALLRGYGEIAPLPPDYEQHIRLTSILITVPALAYTLQRHPPDRFTQQQLDTLRYDLAALF